MPLLQVVIQGSRLFSSVAFPSSVCGSYGSPGFGFHSSRTAGRKSKRNCVWEGFRSQWEAPPSSQWLSAQWLDLTAVEAGGHNLAV